MRENTVKWRRSSRFQEHQNGLDRLEIPSWHVRSSSRWPTDDVPTRLHDILPARTRHFPPPSLHPSLHGLINIFRYFLAENGEPRTRDIQPKPNNPSIWDFYHIDIFILRRCNPGRAKAVQVVWAPWANSLCLYMCSGCICYCAQTKLLLLLKVEAKAASRSTQLWKF